MLGVYLFGDIITTQRASSIGVITLGAMFYTWVQSRKPIPPPELQTPKEQDLEAQVPLRSSTDEQEVEMGEKQEGLPLSPLSPVTERSKFNKPRFAGMHVSHGSVKLSPAPAAGSKEIR